MRFSRPDLYTAYHRSWTSTAQRHIFSEVAVKKDRSWDRVTQVLRSSPHLIRNIHRLHLDARAISFETFSAICEFPFIHLHSICIKDTFFVRYPVGSSLQHLLRLPTLRQMKILNHAIQPATFVQMWTGCSPSLRHLEICDFPEQSHLLQSTPQRSSTPPIVLESLRLWSTRNVSSWLRNDLSPFDLSHLKTLSFCRARIGLLEIPSFAPAFKTIEVLDVSLDIETNAMNLSALPNLKLLRLQLRNNLCFLAVLEMLSTVGASHRIQKVVIQAGYLDSDDRAQLDSALVGLPGNSLLTVELGVNGPAGYLRIDKLNTYFPQMASRNLVRAIDPKENWFENFTGV
ncbi:hypothetical protein FB451DRAFT_1535543 [Mycena latifolia]|nr:hypothetical protein FB451DRAFT_1535543 [Mycena latifolia]